LHLKTRDRRLFEIRALVGYLACKFANVDQKAIAEYFNRSASSTCHAIQKMRNIIREKPAYRHLIEKLIEDLFTP
jgi:chromosomal replication initiation ATPase DnaA